MKKLLTLISVLISLSCFAQNIKYNASGRLISNTTNAAFIDSTSGVRGLTDSINSRLSAVTVSTLADVMSYNGFAQSIFCSGDLQNTKFDYYPGSYSATVDSVVWFPANGKGTGFFKRIYDTSQPVSVRWNPNIKGDDVNDDGSRIIAMFNAGYKKVRFPQGVYNGYLEAKKIDNLSLYLDPGCVFDNPVFHLIGDGPATSTTLRVMKNLNVYGEFVTTGRLGTYYLDGAVFHDGIRHVDSSIYQYQSSVARGSRGDHFYDGSKNITVVGNWVASHIKDSAAEGAIFIDCVYCDSVGKPENINIDNIIIHNSTTSALYLNNTKNVHIKNVYADSYGLSNYYVGYGMNLTENENTTIDNYYVNGKKAVNPNTGGLFVAGNKNLKLGNGVIINNPLRGVLFYEQLSNGKRNENLRFDRMLITKNGSLGAQLQGEFEGGTLNSYGNDTLGLANTPNVQIENSKGFTIENLSPGKDSLINSTIIQNSNNWSIKRVNIPSSGGIAMQLVNDTSFSLTDFYAKKATEGIRLTGTVRGNIVFNSDSLSSREIGNVSSKALTIAYRFGTRWSQNPYADSAFVKVGQWYNTAPPTSTASNPVYRGDNIKNSTPSTGSASGWTYIVDGGGYKADGYLPDSATQNILNTDGTLGRFQSKANIAIDGYIQSKNNISAGFLTGDVVPTANAQISAIDASNNRLEVNGGTTSTLTSINRTSLVYQNLRVRADTFTLQVGQANNQSLKLSNSGVSVGAETLNPTARLHISSGTATAGTASLKINAGTLLTTPEDGAIERTSSHLYTTIGSTRYQLDQQTGTYVRDTSSGITATSTIGQLQKRIDSLSALIVHLSGSETITGTKTFSGSEVRIANSAGLYRVFNSSNTTEIGYVGATGTGMIFNQINSGSLLRFKNQVEGMNMFSDGTSAFQLGGTFTAVTPALVQFNSTTKGVLLPRMTKAQRDAISGAVAGLAIYQTDNTPGLRVYNGTNWIRYTETSD